MPIDKMWKEWHVIAVADPDPTLEEFVPQRITKKEKQILEGFLATVCQICVYLKRIDLGSTQSTTPGGVTVRTRKKIHDQDFDLLLAELRKIVNQGDLANLQGVREVIAKLIPIERQIETDKIDFLFSNKLLDTEHGVHLHLMGQGADWQHLPNTRNLLEAGCNAAAHSSPEPWNRIVRNMSEDRAKAALHAAAFGLAIHLSNYANMTAVSAAFVACKNGDIISLFPRGKDVTYLWMETQDPCVDIALNYRRIIQNNEVEEDVLKRGLLNRTKAKIVFVEKRPFTSIQSIERKGKIKHYETEALLRDIPEYPGADLIGFVKITTKESTALITEKVLEERYNRKFITTKPPR